MGIDLILVVVLVVMVGAIALDRHWAGLEAAAEPSSAEPATAVAVEVPAPAPALPVPDFAELASRSEGWALLGPAGTVVATNLPERAALLAGACAVLRLAQGPDDGAAMAWRTVTLEGPSGILLGEASPSGAVLAVLARREAESAVLRRAMGQALAEVERRWAALPAESLDDAGTVLEFPPAGADVGTAPVSSPTPADPDSAAYPVGSAAAVPPTSAEVAPPDAYTPLD